MDRWLHPLPIPPALIAFAISFLVSPPDQHAGAPVHQAQVQVVDLTAPSHRVLVIIDGQAYGVETIARADGGVTPEPPDKPEPPTGLPPDGAQPSALYEVTDTYLRGMAKNYRGVGDQVKAGKVTNLTQYKEATATARNQAANRLERLLADTWGKAEAIAEDGSFLKPDVVGDSTIAVGTTMEQIIGKSSKP